jgi:hypothetical protein
LVGAGIEMERHLGVIGREVLDAPFVPVQAANLDPLPMEVRQEPLEEGDFFSSQPGESPFREVHVVASP